MADVKNFVTHPFRKNFTDEEWKVYNSWLTKKSSSGGEVYWKCKVIDLTGTWAEIVISRRTGMVGAVSTVSNIVKIGKNIGRSNETTPLQQACKEAGARTRKKIKDGYHVIGDINKQVLKPMLAKLWSDHAHHIKVNPSEWNWQPKLDGHRAIAYILPTKMGARARLEFYSRRGNLISVPHLEDIVFDYDGFLKGAGLVPNTHTIILDGELYSHGTKLQDITRLVRSGVPSKLDYYIYDCCILTKNGLGYPVTTNTIYSLRQGIVKEAIKQMGYKRKICTLESFSKRPIPKIGKHIEIWSVPCISEVAGWAATDKAIALGFEGGMMKYYGGAYREGHRSTDLLKMKRFIDEEFPIIDVTRGDDYKANGKRAIPQALFQLHIDNGNTFEVAAPGTKLEKADFWRTRKKWIGQLCTVKHSGYTKKGIPVHAVAMRIREDI